MYLVSPAGHFHCAYVPCHSFVCSFVLPSEKLSHWVTCPALRVEGRQVGRQSEFGFWLCHWLLGKLFTPLCALLSHRKRLMAVQLKSFDKKSTSAIYWRKTQMKPSVLFHALLVYKLIKPSKPLCLIFLYWIRSKCWVIIDVHIQTTTDILAFKTQNILDFFSPFHRCDMQVANPSC